jgi:hypothetical protein
MKKRNSVRAWLAHRRRKRRRVITLESTKEIIDDALPSIRKALAAIRKIPKEDRMRRKNGKRKGAKTGGGSRRRSRAYWRRR